MREIKLSQNRIAIVDDEDYPIVADFRWSYKSERGRQSG
jgi:hypothetical protein